MFKYIICISIGFIVTNSMFDYGEFDLALTKIEMCPGPKRKNCVELTSEIVNVTELQNDLLVKEDMKGIKCKIVGSLNDKPLLRVEVKNICKHVFLRPLIKTIMNETDRCGLFKGHYVYHVDIETVARNFCGGKFMYGNWTMKMAFYNDHCNMYCATLYLSITPKRSASDDKQ